MNNKLMFIIGLVIFVVYMYFLLTIITKQHKIQKNLNSTNYDVNDFDGIGNQGRISNKQPKRRA